MHNAEILQANKINYKTDDKTNSAKSTNLSIRKKKEMNSLLFIKISIKDNYVAIYVNLFNRSE